MEHERRLDVVAFGDVQQARPELVVLRLAVRGVVAEPVLLEDAARQDDGVVEDGRAEQRPASAVAGAPGVMQVQRDRASVLVDVEDAGADERELRRRDSSRPEARSSQAGKAASSASMRAT